MAEDARREPTSPGDEGRLPPALFKNSLRLWRERWKAEQPAVPAEPVVRHKVRPRPRKGRRVARSD